MSIILRPRNKLLLKRNDPRKLLQGIKTNFEREYQRRLRGDVLVGKGSGNREKFYLDLKALLTHLHIIGATMTGKSYFMEALFRDLILRNFGCCLIDPHGELYQHLVNFLAHFPKLAKKVIFFNPAEAKPFYAGFNPLKRTSYFPDITVQVRFLTAGMAKVWEEESKRTPRLRRVAGNMLYPLVEGKLTFLESQYFVDLDNSEPRKKLVGLTSRQRVLKEWAAFEKYSLPRKLDELGSLQNRLPDFIDTQAIQLIIGRTENVLDFEDLFENKKILLCNLSQRGRLAQDDAFLLGAWLVSEMVNYAKSRQEEQAKENPFFLFLDEFQNFITPDVGKILDECRKFGLHLIMAHQHLAQLKEEDPRLYSSVMTNARTKVVFGGLAWEDVEMIEKEIFPGQHNLKELKDQLLGTKVLAYKEETRLIKGYGKGKGRTEQSGLSSMAGSTLIPGVGGEPGKTTLTTALTDVSTLGTSEAESQIETEAPILIPVMGKEITQRQFWNLEEQRYKKAVKLKGQSVQYAFVKVLGDPPQQVKIRTVNPFLNNKEKQEAVERISYQHQRQYYLLVEEIKTRQEARAQWVEKEEENILPKPTAFRDKRRSKI